MNCEGDMNCEGEEALVRKVEKWYNVMISAEAAKSEK